MKRLFYKGNLGEQYFIKSERAFDALHFAGVTSLPGTYDHKNNEADARVEVFKFLEQRRQNIAKRFLVPPITIIDAVTSQYKYDKERDSYVMVQ